MKLGAPEDGADEFKVEVSVLINAGAPALEELGLSKSLLTG